MNKCLRLLQQRIRRSSPEAAACFARMIQELQIARIHKIGCRACRQLDVPGDLFKINVGSGTYCKEGFLNLDFSKAADIRLDLRKELPLVDNCASIIFSEHFIEHLAYPEGAELFFSECHRVLAPGGILSLSVPDTEWPLGQYSAGASEWKELCRENQWHPEECSTDMEHINYHFRQRDRNVSYDSFNVHRFAWDFETMDKKLREAGFTDVTKREFDSGTDSPHRRFGSLFVSARKPT